MRSTIFKILLILLGCVPKLLDAQSAYLLVQAEDARSFSLMVNKDSVTGSHTSVFVAGINVEIIGLQAKDSDGNLAKGLAFMRLGDTTQVLLNFKEEQVDRKWGLIKIPQDAYRYYYKALYSAAKDTAEALIADKIEIAPAKPKYKIDAASIFKQAEISKEPESVLITKVDSSKTPGMEFCNSFLKNDELKSLKSLLKNTRAIDLQMKFISSGLKEKCLYVNQLGELFKLIEEDDIKVNLYKRLYPQIRDLNNKESLYKEMLLETSIEEIKAYVPQ